MEQEPYSDSYAPTRREILVAGLAVVTLVAAGQQVPGAATAALPGKDAPVAAHEAFLQTSRALTGHADLDAQTASRMYAAMAERAPDFAGQSQRLADIARQNPSSPEDLLGAASAAGLRDTALAIVAAWYTGTVGSDSAGTVVAYRNALMYRPVSDAMSAPTYCPAGPAWWTCEPPAIGVSPPVERPAGPAPTTGFPVQTEQPPAAPRAEPQGRGT